MDISNFKTSDWLKVGGGALMLIASFMAWWQLDTIIGTFSANGWDYFLTGIVPTVLLVAVAVLTVLAASGKWKLPDTIPPGPTFLGAAALSLLLVVIRFIFDGEGEVDLDRGIGLFLALIAAALVLAGSVMGFKESGGDLNDLKDLDSIKDQLGIKRDGGPTPPAPPAP